MRRWLSWGQLRTHTEGGKWLTDRLRRWQQKRGTYQSARNAWHWGVPIEVTLRILCK